jgi:biopolymer transport protein ExbB
MWNDYALQFLTFMEMGGDILWFIFALTWLMWLLIIERVIFFFLHYPQRAECLRAAWRNRDDQETWHGRQIKRQWIAQLNDELRWSLPFLKALVATCPLLGLLGTVTGMMEVFDILAIGSANNTRAMAFGVSRATMPTMAGMAAALPGIYILAQLRSYADKASRHFAQTFDSKSS